MSYEEWAIHFFGGLDLAPRACRDAWEAAAKAEREKCAKVCDSYVDWGENWGMYSNEMLATDAAKECAQAIRAMED